MNPDLERAYTDRRDRYLQPVADGLLSMLVEYFESRPRIDRITARVKSIESFLDKASKKKGGVFVYDDPLNQIQDQIGARIVTFYRCEIDSIADTVLQYFRPIEDQLIVPEKESEFGYFGRHFVLFCPTDAFGNDSEQEYCPKFFELQVKTLYQHAWSEANHDLGYKEGESLTSEEKRKVAFTAAQSWGADTIFEELFREKSNKAIESDA